MRSDEVTASAEGGGDRKARRNLGKKSAPGQQESARIRSAPLHERAAAGLGLQYGATIGEITHAVLTGMKLKNDRQKPVGRLILNKILPAARPVQLDFPQIRTAADLIEAEERINAGAEPRADLAR